MGWIGAGPGIVAATLAIVATCSSPPTSAQAPSNRELAEIRLQEGTRAFRTGRYDQALEAFIGAHALQPSPRVEYNMAETLLALKRDAEAADAFDAFLAHAPTEASEYVDQARRQVATLSSRGLTINFACARDEAIVTVDDHERTLPRLAERVRTSAGSHWLAVRSRDSTLLARERVDGRHGDQVTVSLCAPPEVVTAPPPAAAPALVAAPVAAEPKRRGWIGTRAAVAAGALLAVVVATIVVVAATRDEPPSSSLGNYPL
jgi:hypothetical protein